MAQPPTKPDPTPAGLGDRGGDRFQAQRADRSTAGLRLLRVRTHVVGQVVVLEVAGRLSDVVEDLDLAIQLALADGPRGVACDLSAVFEGAQPGAVDVLATAGRHVRDWPAIPVAVPGTQGHYA